MFSVYLLFKLYYILLTAIPLIIITVGPFCNALFSEIQSTSIGRIVWRQLKPMIRGIITYTPNTKTINDIIKEVLMYILVITNTVFTKLFNNLEYNLIMNSNF